MNKHILFELQTSCSYKFTVLLMILTQMISTPDPNLMLLSVRKEGIP
jgi:hypothetical protein